MPFELLLSDSFFSIMAESSLKSGASYASLFENILNRSDTSLGRCVGMRNPKTILKKDLESTARENDCPGRS